jgi:hypothetical protein
MSMLTMRKIVGAALAAVIATGMAGAAMAETQ